MFFLPADMRISDSEREAAVEFLKRHYAAGRLSDAELSARVDAAYAARYDSELAELTWDLPSLPPEGRLARRSTTSALAPAAAAGGLAVGGVATALLLPPEMWATLLALGLPLLMMALFTIVPIALPVLAVLAVLRQMARGPSPRAYD